MFSLVTALGCLLRFSNERAVLFSHRMLLFLYIYLYHIVSVLSYDGGLLRKVFSVRKNLEKPFFLRKDFSWRVEKKKLCNNKINIPHK